MRVNTFICKQVKIQLNGTEFSKTAQNLNFTQISQKILTSLNCGLHWSEVHLYFQISWNLLNYWHLTPMFLLQISIHYIFNLLSASNLHLTSSRSLRYIQYSQFKSKFLLFLMRKLKVCSKIRNSQIRESPCACTPYEYHRIATTVDSKQTICNKLE